MELIVAIAIIAILSGAAIATLDPFSQFEKAADSKRKSDLAQVQRAVEAFYQDFGRYPEATINYAIDSNADPDTIEERAWGTGWSPYIDVLPRDSDSNKTYIYVTDISRQSYWIFASLGRGANDPDACHDDGSACNSVPSGVACGESGNICNYGVSSPNVSP